MVLVPKEGGNLRLFESVVRGFSLVHAPEGSQCDEDKDCRKQSGEFHLEANESLESL